MKHGGSLNRLMDDGAGAVSVCSDAKQKERPTQQITDKDKAQLPTAKQPETDREKPERAGELAPLAHKKRPQDRQQTETDGERKRQIQYQLIPSSLPKSTLP